MSEIIHEQSLFAPMSPLATFCEPDAHGRCLTCSDEALPARVRQVNDAWTAVADVNGQPTEIDVSLVDDVAVGQVVLVHGGVALGRLETGDWRLD